MVRLTDEEIRNAMTEAMDDGQLYGDDGEPLPEKGVAIAQLKKVVGWLEERRCSSDAVDVYIEFKKALLKEVEEQ